MEKIDDEQIKKLISEYQQTGKGISEIIELLSEYIFNYPGNKGESEDTCSKFYIYFIQRFPSALLKYKIWDCMFVTWLTPVLRNHFLNWVAKYRKESIKSVLYLEDFTYQSDKLAYEDYNLDHNKEIKDDTIIKIINLLPPKVRVAMKLHYFDFFEGGDLKIICKIFNKDISTLLNKYDNILSHVLSQHEKGKEYLDKVNSAFSQLSYYREKLNFSKNRVLKTDEKEKLIKKIEQYKERHEKMLYNYRRFHVSVKSNLIGDFLDISVNAVHNLIYRGKLLLKQKLTEIGYDK